MDQEWLNNNMLRRLFNSTPDAMIISDHEGKIVLMNEQMEALFGYHSDELLGQPIELLIPKALRERHQHHRSKYFNQPTVRAMGSNLELTALRKDGSEFPVEISLSPINLENGYLIASAIRDVTDAIRSQKYGKRTTADHG